MQLWQKGLCGGLLSRSMLVRLQSAVPIDGKLVKSSYDTSLLTRRGRKVARRSEACTFRQPMLNFITVTKCHTILFLYELKLNAGKCEVGSNG